MLGLTRIVIGQAGGVVDDAAQRFADGRVTAKTKVGQISTAEVSTSESTPSSTAKAPSMSVSVTDPWRPFFINTPFAPQRAETRLHYYL
jgi:hypothetical protein